MMVAKKQTPLIERLPVVRGTYEEQVSLANLTWFRVGGPAEVLFRPADTADLAEFLRSKPADVPVTVIGVGSNILVRDGGIGGVVIRLSRAFARIEVEGDRIIAGASAPDVAVAIAAQEAGLSGLEFLRGVPGTIGGAVRMNAGAYDREVSDILVAVDALDQNGVEHRLSAAALNLSYRHSELPEGWIVVSAVLQGRPASPEEISDKMAAITEVRAETQPVTARTGGSTFKNPPGAKAWELIDEAGCRGLSMGGAQVSEHHCNFMINTGDASAADIERLGEEVRRRVHKATGVTLEWEIRIIGDHAGSGVTS